MTEQRTSEERLSDAERLDWSQPSVGRKVIRDVASASVHVPTADPDCDGSGHPAGLQSGAPPREAKGGGVPGNAGTAACDSTSETRPICPGCKCEYDPDWCHCGDSKDGHSAWSGHTFVPMGCQCGRYQGEDL